jgi:hypothetical protein
MKSTTLTTLQTLNDMAHGFLAPGFPDWLPKAKNLVPMRPEDDELRQGQEEFNALLDKLATLPSYRRLEEGIQTGQMRRLKDEGDGGEGHLLFRPVGQTALASALGQLHFDKDNPRELEPLFEKLRRFDDAGGFRMEDPSSLWYMVLYDPNKKRMQIRGERLATRLLVYLLGGLADAIEREELRAALAEEQTIDGKALGFDGEWTDPANIQLPPPL